MMQDLKVGHILGGTPRNMQKAEIIGVIAAALVLVWPMILMHKVYVIGSDILPAPQAGLMALMAKGIVGGDMAWPLVIVGMLMAVALILIKAPSPMLIAVGMYLPFTATAGIFMGGIIRYLMNEMLSRRNVGADATMDAENTGVLISSGLIVGQSLMALVLAFVVLGRSFADSTLTGMVPLISIPGYPGMGVVGMLVFALLGYALIRFPIESVLPGKK